MTTLNKAVSATLDDVSATAITNVVSATQDVKGKTKKMTDLLVGRGVKSSMLDKPSKKTDANPNATLQFSITQAIIKGLPIEWQSLISKDTKTLSESDKSAKRYAQQQVGSYYGKVKRALIDFENPKSSSARVTRSAVERIIDSLNDAIEVAEKIEEPNFDVAGFKKIVASAKAMVK
jgi:hypothetical protein